MIDPTGNISLLFTKDWLRDCYLHSLEEVIRRPLTKPELNKLMKKIDSALEERIDEFMSELVCDQMNIFSIELHREKNK